MVLVRSISLVFFSSTIFFAIFAWFLEFKTNTSFTCNIIAYIPTHHKKHTWKCILRVFCFVLDVFFPFNSALLYAMQCSVCVCVCVWIKSSLNWKKKYIAKQKKGWPPTIEWKKACEKMGIMMWIACNYEYFFAFNFHIRMY